MALIAALLGWMFDGFEMGVFSLIGIAAVKELLNTSDNGVARIWIAVINAGFLVGAATGGVLFGWLGDRIGRVRAMTFSVLTYAVFTGLCGFCAEAWQVGLLRFIAALGMGGEWSLGVALVMEVWPNRSRAFMAGLIGAAANVGYVLVGIVGLVLAGLMGQVIGSLESFGFTADQAQKLIGNTGWRLVMMVGILPALLTFFIRMFVPESEKWEKEQESGAVSNWVSSDLWAVVAAIIGPALIIVVWATPGNEASWWVVRLVVTALGLAGAIVGYSYPAYRFCQRSEAAGEAEGFTRRTISRMLLAACLSGVALLGTWGTTQNIPNWMFGVASPADAPSARSYALIALSLGAVLGTLVAANLGNWLGRRWTYVLMCAASMASILNLFGRYDQYSFEALCAAFLTGACTASFYGWLPLYLPELFGTKVRATGQGFGFNFGRVLAAIGTLQITALVEATKHVFTDKLHVGPFTIAPGWPVICTALSGIYLVGMVLIWFAPETQGKPLPE